MNEDLIKRSDATEVVYKALKTPPLKGVLTDTMSLAIALVRDIPSADRPQGEWIPCSERLPSSSGKCLVTEGAEQKTTSIGYFSAEYKRFYSAMDVIAWMPLPDPYGEREGE